LVKAVPGKHFRRRREGRADIKPVKKYIIHT